MRTLCSSFYFTVDMISWLGTASVTPQTQMTTQITSYKNGYINGTSQ